MTKVCTHGRDKDLALRMLEESLRNRCRVYAGDGRFELYKVSLKYDNPEARIAHGFPIDMQQREVKEMVREVINTGKPFPEYK